MWRTERRRLEALALELRGNLPRLVEADHRTPAIGLATREQRHARDGDGDRMEAHDGFLPTE